MLNTESNKLTNIVKGYAVQLDTTNTYAIEKQAAIPICYGSAEGAWDAAVAYNGSESNYPGKTFDNVGWVRGTKLSHGDWGAYLWTLRNRIAFKSSATNMWVSSNGIPVVITNVMVGSLGDYRAMSNVVDIGPDINEATNSYPGAGESDSGTYYADITNVYYQLIIPDIWITPRDVVVAAGSSDAIRFTVTGTNIANEVNWTMNPSGLSGGAEMQTMGYWYYRDVIPGNVATNYKVRATSKDNTNFYDEVNLNVLKVEIKKPAGDPTTEPNAYNERTYNSANPGVATVACEAEDTPNADKLRWTIEDVGEIQATWEPHVDGNTHIGKGLNPTATFTGLPAQYTGFGSKTITLTMDEPGITSSDTQEVEIFFPRSATNHSFIDPNDPKQEGPNWYYYSLQILPCIADNWGYENTEEQPAWTPANNYTEGWIRFTAWGCPFDPFYYIGHENKHHTDFFQEIWEGTGYESDADDDEDGIRDDFEIEHYGNLNKTFTEIMDDWSEPRAASAGQAASSVSNWNQYWCDPGTLKGYQP